MIDSTLDGSASTPESAGELDELVEGGLRLWAYAAVLGYSGAGVALEDCLQHMGLTGDAWERASRAWERRLIADAQGDGVLVDRCDELRIDAENAVERDLGPYDEDPTLLLDLAAAMGRAPDPLAFLADHGLSEGDLFRLLGRMGETPFDKKLGERARQAGAAERTLPTVQPSPPTIPPESRRLRTTDDEPAPEPFMPPESAPTTSPMGPNAVGPATPFEPDTITMEDFVRRPATPFESATRQQSSTPPPTPPDEREHHESDTLPAVLFEARPSDPPIAAEPTRGSSAPPPPKPRLSQLEYAELYVALTKSTELARAAVAERGWSHAELEQEHAAWRARFERDHDLYRKWCAQVADLRS